jgi:putative tricarboxylic transport membrane protein
MRRSEKIDLFCSLFWLSVGGLISYGAVRLGLGSIRDPGPGLIPLLIGSFLELLALILLARSLSSKVRKETVAETILGENWKKRGAVVISLLAYSILLSVLGFLISTFLLLSFLFNISGTKGWYVRVIGAAVLVVACFFVFRVWLGCPLPLGILQMNF